MHDRHAITITVNHDGTVQGDLNDGVPLWPIGTESTAESTTIDGQARSILDQALQRILSIELGGGSTTKCSACDGTGVEEGDDCPTCDRPNTSTCSACGGCGVSAQVVASAAKPVRPSK